MTLRASLARSALAALSCLTGPTAVAAAPPVDIPGARGRVLEAPPQAPRASLRSITIDGPGLRQGPALPERARIRWAPLDLDTIRREDAASPEDPRRAMRVGVGRPMPERPISPGLAGEWLNAGDEVIWRVALEAPGGQGVRIHFSAFDLPAGARVVVQGDGGRTASVYEGRGPLGDGAFWTPASFGETFYIEYQAPAEAPMPSLRIEQISHLYRGFAGADAGAVERGGGDPCAILDVNCRAVDPVARDSVARYTFIDEGSTFLCSGCLLNDADPNTQAGWFLTAEHCVGSQSAADSVTAYWFYQADSCGGAAPSLSTLPRSFGATLLASDPSSDFALLRLNDDPNAGQGFAGFTSVDPPVGSSVHMIHHALGGPKKYTQGLIVDTGPQCGGGVSTINWDEVDGRTQEGSSGSPLFDSNWRVVTTLFGICYIGPFPGCGTDTDRWNTWGPRLSAQTSVIQSYLLDPAEDDALEDNDDFASARPIALGESTLRLVDFADYFTIETCQTSDIFVAIGFDDAEMDAEIRLLDAGGGLLAMDGANGGSGGVFAGGAPGGVYVLRIDKVGGWGGDYTLDVFAGSGADANANGVPDECDPGGCAWDLNGDALVNGVDLSRLLSNWGLPYSPADLSGLLSAWGPCP